MAARRLHAARSAWPRAPSWNRATEASGDPTFPGLGWAPSIKKKKKRKGKKKAALLSPGPAGAEEAEAGGASWRCGRRLGLVKVGGPGGLGDTCRLSSAAEGAAGRAGFLPCAPSASAPAPLRPLRPRRPLDPGPGARVWGGSRGRGPSPRAAPRNGGPGRPRCAPRSRAEPARRPPGLGGGGCPRKSGRWAPPSRALPPPAPARDCPAHALRARGRGRRASASVWPSSPKRPGPGERPSALRVGWGLGLRDPAGPADSCRLTTTWS